MISADFLLPGPGSDPRGQNDTDKKCFVKKKFGSVTGYQKIIIIMGNLVKNLQKYHIFKEIHVGRLQHTDLGLNDGESGKRSTALGFGHLGGSLQQPGVCRGRKRHRGRVGLASRPGRRRSRWYIYF
jgi:hypothetical protein